MGDPLYLITLVGTLLVLAAAFSSFLAQRFGAPLLLVFLCIGLLTGVDGLGIEFDNAPAAYFVGSLALAVILFDSGFGTSRASLKQAAAPALLLATVGVVLTAAMFGVAAHYLTGLGWMQSFLLAAAVSSTDAAAVFFLLRSGGTSLRDRVRSTLEIESGSNDPMAIFLTLSVVQLAELGVNAGPGVIAADFAVRFLAQIGIGAAAGLAGGWLIARVAERLRIEASLLPVFVLALSLLVFGITGAVGGSGFLAVYVAGVVAGNSSLRSTANLKRFQDGMTWLAQIIMFLILGLFATPSQFPSIALPAVALGLFLIFVARPAAVWLCLLPFRLPLAEQAFVSWVGLRGAVSILLAITPLIAGLEQSRMIFNIAFIVVLVSLVVQGWTIRPLAMKLGLVVPARSGPLHKFELELPGSAHHELLAYRVVEGSPVTRGERIPRWARPSLVVRDGRSMTYQTAGRPVAGDYLYIFVPNRYPPLLDRLFASPTELSRDDTDYFGALTLDPHHRAADLAAQYGIELSEEEGELSIAEMMTARLGGRAEYADRLIVDPIELIVRDVGENGAITGIGLAFEPQPRQPVSPRPPWLRRLVTGLGLQERSPPRPGSAEG